jgi:hypothetical protein
VVRQQPHSRSGMAESQRRRSPLADLKDGIRSRRSGVDSRRGGGRSRLPPKRRKSHWRPGRAGGTRESTKVVDSRRGGDRSRAPSDGQAKSHWRRRPPDEAVTDEIRSRRSKLTPNAVVVEAASLRNGESRAGGKKRVDEAS